MEPQESVAPVEPPEPSASFIEHHLGASPRSTVRPPSSAGMDEVPSLITIIRAVDVTAEYKKIAAAWPLWDSKTHPQKPKGSGKFPFDYNGDYATERVLITKGLATLTPAAGLGPPVSIGCGDAVYFHKGFKCNWKVHERMEKHYAYYGEDGEPMPEEGGGEGISCDICGVDCFAESYLFADADGSEVDLCTTCFSKDTAKYAGAEHQLQGEPAPVPSKKQKTKKK